MKRVLIAGADSYIGTSFENYIGEHYPNDFKIDTVDMRDDGWREKSFSGYDAVFHVAGIAHQRETKENERSYFEINRDLAFETAQKAKEEGVAQFVFLSSMSVYGMLTGHITKDTELKPNTNYGKSKLEAEQTINSLNDTKFKVCILRPPMIYGKGCKGNYQTLRKFALKLKFFPYVKNERSMLYIQNLCEFVRLMIENGESGTFFPQNDEYSNTSEMVKLIAAAHGKKVYLVKGFGWALKFLGLFTGLVKKAFGSLTYDTPISKYKSEYHQVSVIESIQLSEKNGGGY